MILEISYQTTPQEREPGPGAPDHPAPPVPSAAVLGPPPLHPAVDSQQQIILPPKQEKVKYEFKLYMVYD